MTAINESLTAKGYTRAADVPAVFGRPRTIEGIVIHHWGALGQTHDGVVDFFVNGPGQTSAHFVVSAGRIHCLVSPLDAAWHSGNAVGNATTIGIECRPEATAGDYLTVAELVRWLRDEYGDLPLSPHRQWQSTACPGVWDLNRINTLAAAAPVTAQSTTTTPATGGLTMADINSISKQLNELLERTKPIDTAAGAVSLRQFIADGTRAAQAAEKQTGPINVSGGQEGIRDFIAKGTRAAQATAAKIAGLEAALKTVIQSSGSEIDLEAVTKAAEAGAAKALSENVVSVDVNVNGKAAV